MFDKHVEFLILQSIVLIMFATSFAINCNKKFVCVTSATLDTLSRLFTVLGFCGKQGHSACKKHFLQLILLDGSRNVQRH